MCDILLSVFSLNFCLINLEKVASILAVTSNMLHLIGQMDLLQNILLESANLHYTSCNWLQLEGIVGLSPHVLRNWAFWLLFATIPICKAFYCCSFMCTTCYYNTQDNGTLSLNRDIGFWSQYTYTIFLFTSLPPKQDFPYIFLYSLNHPNNVFSSSLLKNCSTGHGTIFWLLA